MSVESDQGGDRWRDVRETVLERDGYECRFCGTTNEEHLEEHDRGLEAHHVIPQADGGPDTPANLITVCISCHRTFESTHAKAMGALSRDRISPESLHEGIDDVDSHIEMWCADAIDGGASGPEVRNYRITDGCRRAFDDYERAVYLLGKAEGARFARNQIRGFADVDEEF